jgi:hypothetical protein
MFLGTRLCGGEKSTFALANVLFYLMDKLGVSGVLAQTK